MDRALIASNDLALRCVALEDRYRLEAGPVYLNGVQALVRLLIEQSRLDGRSGIASAGFVSGYRGSPLGGFDLALWQAAEILRQHRVRFDPGLNEELAATMVQGSQQVGLIGGAQVAGVFGLWYAKNPGVDRAGDALKHANAAGTAALGGVLAVSGDDPGATSSSIPNQCEHAFAAALMPTLAPASLAEIIELGLAGWALSRFAGTWVGFKTVADVVEASGSVTLPPTRRPFVRPDGFDDPTGPLGIRWPDSRWQQDERLQLRRLPAARAFARANALDRRVFGAPHARIGIVCAGKVTGDVREALALLDIDHRAAQYLGIAVFQVVLVWPLEPGAIREFAEGLDELIVVEERRAVLEPQVKEQAWLWNGARRPVIIGKCDEHGAPLLPETGVLNPLQVARALAERLLRRGAPDALRTRIADLAPPPALALPAGEELVRSPHFCAGCPHARATRVPEGGLAMAGIGCHSLRLGMPESQTMFMVQMGGEGSNWLGAAPFVRRAHVFQNLGDGTYGHSGSLAVRAAVAAGARMTFRILYNGAVAMTGGQMAEGALEVAQIAAGLQAEGVRHIAVVAEEPARHAGRLPVGVTLHGRPDLARIQRELAALPGVTALIHDQLCAIEKRRRRRRGELPPVASRPFINERVCEGCGDCVDQSQCSALLPVDTVLGPKRRIDASACNVELSCLDGLCPSFVSVQGARLRRPQLPALSGHAMPEPVRPRSPSAEIVVHGIGGSGVVTVGALLGMAAHLEGRGCSVLDNTGIARKGGAVSSHVRIGADGDAPHGSRIPDGRATLVIAADLVGAAESAALAKLARGRTQVVLNADALPTLNQRLDAQAVFDPAPLRQRLAAVIGEDAITTVAAGTLAERLLGDGIYTNLLLLGAAFQRGEVPLSLTALERALELNGQDVAANRKAFDLGRLAVHSPQIVERALDSAAGAALQPPAAMGLETLIADRSERLRAYQDERLAARYTALVHLAREAEERIGAGGDALARSVASAFHRLLAVKDEYEVARLYGDGQFKAELDRRFEPGYTLRYHLAPPLIATIDPATGRPRKRSYGPWVAALWPALARLRVLRGSWLDPFGHTAERRAERQLLVDYETTLRRLLAKLTRASHPLVLQYAALPERVRGFGAVKLRNLQAARAEAARILAQLAALPD